MNTRAFENLEDFSMRKIISRIGKDGFIYGGSLAISNFIAFFTAPVMTRIFTPQDYGVISLIATTVAIVSMFLGINMVSGLFRFFYQEKDERVIVSSTFFYFVGISAPLTLLLMYFAVPINDLIFRDAHVNVAYFRLGVLQLPFLSLIAFVTTVLRLLHKPKQYLFINALRSVLYPTILFSVVFLYKKELYFVFLVQLIVAVLVAVLGLILIRRLLTFTFSIDSFKKMISYCLPAFPAVMINSIISRANQYFLVFFVGLHDLGLFSAALRISSLVAMGVLAFRTAWDPMGVAIIGKKNSRNIYAKIFLLHNIMFAAVAILLVCFVKEVVGVLLGSKFLVAYILCGPLILSRIIDGSNNLLGRGISVSKKTKFISYSQAIVLVINVAANFLFISNLGAVGAAWALVVTGLAQGICYYIFSSKLYYIPYLMQHNLAILFVYLIVYLLSTQVDQSKIGFIFALQFKFLFCIFGFFVLWLVLRNGLNKHNRLAPIYVGGE